MKLRTLEMIYHYQKIGKRTLSLFLACLMIMGLAAPALSVTFAVVTTEERAPVSMAGELSDGDGTYTVRVSFDESAQIPEGASLVTSEVFDGSYLRAAEEGLAEGRKTVYSRFFDITIVDAGGNPVQPAVPVNVAIETFDAPEDAQAMVFHYPTTDLSTSDDAVSVDEQVSMDEQAEDGDAALAESELANAELEGLRLESPLGLKKSPLRANRELLALDDAGTVVDAPVVEESEGDLPLTEPVIIENSAPGVIEFTADGFSVYGVVYTIIYNGENGVYINQGDGYSITINIPEEAQLPLGTNLIIEEINRDSNLYISRFFDLWNEINTPYFEYKERISLSEDDDSTENVELINIFDARFFDVHFIYEDEEIEPAVPVQLVIEFNDGLNMPDDSEPEKIVIGAVHFAEEGTEIIGDVETTLEDGKLVAYTYEQNGFSGTGTFVGLATREATIDEAYPYLAKLRENIIDRSDTVEGLRKALAKRELDPADLNKPVANKWLEENKINGKFDGTYKLNLSVKGTKLSSTTADVKKSNILIVMDRSSSMNSNSTYVEYDGEIQSNVTYYREVVNETSKEYTELTNINNVLYHQEERPYSGTRYSRYWDGGYNGHWVYYQANNGDYGLIDGEYVELHGSGNNRTYSANIEHTGKIYVKKTRLEAEQAALAEMVTELMGNNQPSGTYLTDDNGDPILDDNGNRIMLDDLVEVAVMGFGGYAYKQTGVPDSYLNHANDPYGYYNQTDSRTDMEATFVDWTHGDDPSGIIGTDGQYQNNNNGSGIMSTFLNKGTNWEDALNYALTVANAKKAAQPDEDVYVIFLTDGEPTAWVGEKTARHFNPNTEGGCEAGYLPTRDDARRLVATGHKLYGIFTYGNEDWQKNYLIRLINSAYSETWTDDDLNHNDDGETSDPLYRFPSYTFDTADATTDAAKAYYTDADTTDALIAAFRNIINTISESLSYGGASISDGLTTDATATTVVSGKADGFTYTVKNELGQDVYTVTASTDDEGVNTVTFKDAATGEEKSTTEEKTYTYTVPSTTSSNTTETVTKTYYSVDFGTEEEPKEYKIALASLSHESGEVDRLTWDLGGIGTLQKDYTYSVCFDVWPDQEAYDYATNLNNGALVWNERTAVPVYANDGTTILYYKGGTKYGHEDIDGYYVVDGEKYPSIVKMPDGSYTVLTNTDQTMSYYVVDEKDGEDPVYKGPYDVTLVPPTPMPLMKQMFTVEKEWNDDVNPGHRAESITFTLLRDGKYYQNDGSVMDLQNHEEIGVVEVADAAAFEAGISKGIVYYTREIVENGGVLEYQYVEATEYDLTKTYYMTYHDAAYVNSRKITVSPSGDWKNEIGIAPGLMRVYRDETGNITKTEILDTGHDYALEEYDAVHGDHYYDFSFVFISDIARPMIINGELVNLVKITSDHPAPAGSTIYTLPSVLNPKQNEQYYVKAGGSSVTGTNYKTSELDISKMITLGGKNANFENKMFEKQTFTYRVTLTFDMEDDISGITGYEYVRTPGGFTLYGYNQKDTETTTGNANDSDVDHHSGYRYSSCNTDIYRWDEESDHYLIAYDETNNKKSVTVDMTLNWNEVIRFTNLPIGTEYTIQELYVNKYEAGNTEGGYRPIVNPENDPNYIGYSAYTLTEVNRKPASDYDAETGIVRGTISEFDTRYYNQFVNDVKAIDLTLNKIGDNNPNNILPGVEFLLYFDEDMTEVVTLDANGTPLAYPIYDTTPGHEENIIGYSTRLVTDEQGNIHIGKLLDGTYYLVETKTVDGYNMLTQPVKIIVKESGDVPRKTIDADDTVPEDDYTLDDVPMYITFLYGKIGETVQDHFDRINVNVSLEAQEDGTIMYVYGYTLQINNLSGYELPSTGGSGTAALTIAGTILAITSGFVISRRRKEDE